VFEKHSLAILLQFADVIGKTNGERETAAAAFFGFPEWMQNSKLEGNILHLENLAIIEWVWKSAWDDEITCSSIST
jgi:hypothetical protein